MPKNYRILFCTNTFKLYMQISHERYHIKEKIQQLLQLQYKNYVWVWVLIIYTKVVNDVVIKFQLYDP